MTDPRPNIIFTICDTQPTAFLGCYAGTDRGTPNLDALAAAGTRFDRAYTACPLCTPARAALFSGMTPTRSGAYTNSQALGDTIRTMGQIMTDADYRCAYIGKWHLDGHDYFGDGACPAGWEDAYWFDGKRYMLSLTKEQTAAWRQGMYTPEALRAGGFAHSEATWAHGISDRAERFLAEQTNDKPALLVCSYDEPHHPFTCPPEWVERYGDMTIDVGPSAFDDLSNKPRHHQEWAASTSFGTPDGPQPTYANGMMLACNAYVDSQIGRVINAARALAERTGRPTWIIHTADHGDHCGSHRMNNKGPTGYDWNTRVPLIVCPPSGSEQATGVVQGSVVSLLDIVPTFCELGAAPVPPTCDGQSIADLCGHEERAIDRVAPLEYTRYEVGHDGFGGLQPLRGLVKWPYKYIVNLFGSDELYHLGDDPDELRNLINDEAAAPQRDALHQALIEYMNDHEDPWRGAAWENRPYHQIPSNVWGQYMRPLRLNGRQPPYADYDTGLPTRGAAAQYDNDD